MKTNISYNQTCINKGRRHYYKIIKLHSTLISNFSHLFQESTINIFTLPNFKKNNNNTNITKIHQEYLFRAYVFHSVTVKIIIPLENNMKAK